MRLIFRFDPGNIALGREGIVNFFDSILDAFAEEIFDTSPVEVKAAVVLKIGILVFKVDSIDDLLLAEFLTIGGGLMTLKRSF